MDIGNKIDEFNNSNNQIKSLIDELVLRNQELMRIIVNMSEVVTPEWEQNSTLWVMLLNGSITNIVCRNGVWWVSINGQTDRVKLVDIMKEANG